MMYIEDCLRGTMEFLEADDGVLTRRTYNLSAVSFTPEEFYHGIRSRLPKENTFDVRIPSYLSLQVISPIDCLQS